MTRARRDGLEATRAIRLLEDAGREQAEGACARIPIVALTAHALARDKARCTEAGMDGYFTKSIRLEALSFRRARAAASGGALQIVRIRLSLYQN